MDLKLCLRNKGKIPREEDDGPTIQASRSATSYINTTISKDNTDGEDARNARLLEQFGKKLQRKSGPGVSLTADISSLRSLSPDDEEFKTEGSVELDRYQRGSLSYPVERPDTGSLKLTARVIEQPRALRSQPGRDYPVCCLYPGCNAKPFKRRVDLDRHYKQYHASKSQKVSFNCDYPRCSRRRDPFHRLDHFHDHLREFHKEDIEKRGGPVNQEWFENRRVSSTWWRCSKCLHRIYIEKSGYECPDCKTPCQTKQQRRPRRAATPTWGVDQPATDNENATPAGTPGRRGAAAAARGEQGEKVDGRRDRRRAKDKDKDQDKDQDKDGRASKANQSLSTTPGGRWWENRPEATERSRIRTPVGFRAAKTTRQQSTRPLPLRRPSPHAFLENTIEMSRIEPLTELSGRDGCAANQANTQASSDDDLSRGPPMFFTTRRSFRRGSNQEIESDQECQREASERQRQRERVDGTSDAIGRAGKEMKEARRAMGSLKLSPTKMKSRRRSRNRV
ncbi:hypothetical protein QQS21_008034 [Conoideocrella luteorostrata]|uniref:C2H2-type domain-containing protein n=1 Tax=Conoideocrella luteorostrata TaxID=1105319 RepID=A0AAJ0FZ02_9HYPO|nr:hypothetical protein QQS21_008034 [Conoideocrella luteorostrata]